MAYSSKSYLTAAYLIVSHQTLHNPNYGTDYGNEKQTIKEKVHLVDIPEETTSEPSLKQSKVTTSNFQATRRPLQTAGYMMLNTIATVVTVFLNKIIVTEPQLRNCQIIFAIWHFFATFLVLYIAGQRPFRLFDLLRLPLHEMLPICTLFAGFLVLNNLSLALNPIGFYQLAKTLTTPTLVLLNIVLLQKTISQGKMVAVLTTCLGVGLTNTGAAITNPLGAGVAVAAFTVTALYQLWIGKKMQDFTCNAPQLLINQAPVAILILMPFVPLLDQVPNFAMIPPKILLCFGISGLSAAMINLSQFLIIGQTSALTFNIVGMLKTIAIVSGGWFLEGKLLAAQDLVGVVLALGGAWAYAQSSS